MSNIAAKLVKVMGECGYVQKQGTNDFHKYRYATAADILEKVNAALVKHNIATVAMPELIDIRDVVTAKGNTEHLATVQTTLTLIDGETGETLQLVGLGSGQDAGDKAVMKGQTASLKYAYLLSLAISTGDDPEADSSVDESTGVPDEKAIALTPVEQPGTLCADCGISITSGVHKVSVSKYQRPLCMACQRKRKSA